MRFGGTSNVVSGFFEDEEDEEECAYKPAAVI